MVWAITVNGVDRSGVVRRKTVVWAESAYLTEVGGGKIVVDDVAGTIVIPGWKAMSVEQSSSTPSRLFSGFTHRKTIRLGKDAGIRPPGREIEVATVDLNDLLRRFVIRGAGAAGGKRPAESIGDRATWLLASPFLSTLVADYGAVEYPDIGLDKAIVKGRYPADVLVEMAKAVRFNCYVRYKAGEALAELVFRDENASTADTCTLSISNYPGDANGTTVFAPLEEPEAELTQDPEDVYSGAYASHGEGHVYRTRPATATEFTARDGITESSDIRSDATASRDADTFLHESRDEEQSLPAAIKLNETQVGLVKAGMRISTRMQHMTPEGWEPARYARILRTRVTQPLDTDFTYHVAMDLSPQEAGPAAPAGMAIVQSAFDRSGEGGIDLTLPNPVTIGNLLVFVSGDRGVANPASPNYLNGALARFGSTAWTKLPNTTNVDDYNSGVAIWYKIADTAERSGWVPSSSANMGIFEISGATVAGAATLDETLQASSSTMSLGSLGTPAAGRIGIAVILWADQRLWGAPMPGVTPVSPWLTDRFDSSFEGGAITENEPFVWIGHVTATGAALTCSITRTDATVLSGIWAGAALLLA